MAVAFTVHATHPLVSNAFPVRVMHGHDAFAPYQIKDCSLPILGDVFFIILILWGSFFTLNLLLAVLEGNFTKGKEDDKVFNNLLTSHKCSTGTSCESACHERGPLQSRVYHDATSDPSTIERN